MIEILEVLEVLEILEILDTILLLVGALAMGRRFLAVVRLVVVQLVVRLVRVVVDPAGRFLKHGNLRHWIAICG